MVLPFSLIFGIVFCLSHSCSSCYGRKEGRSLWEDDLKLEYVQVLWRHGDRSPVTIYPNDPNANFWPQGEGMLTQKGMQQHYALGQYLRTRLGTEFVSQHYLRNETYIVSSHEDRTIESAASNLASFYKPTDWQVFDPNLPWQPVPVHTIPESQDHMIDPIWTGCPKWVLINDAFQLSRSFRAVERSNQDLLDFLTLKTGMTVDMNNVGLIYDNFVCTTDHQRPLPEWVTPEIVQNTSVAGNYVFFNLFRTPEQKRIMGGSLLKTIRDTFQSVVEGKRDSLKANRLTIYSGHDTTIMALTFLLNVFNGILVPYAAAIIMELYSDGDDDFYFRMSYHNDSTHKPYVLRLGICDYNEFCDWEDFYERTQDLILDNWYRECYTSNLRALPQQNNVDYDQMTKYFLLLVSSLLIMFLVFELFCWYRKHRSTSRTKVINNLEFNIDPVSQFDAKLHSVS